MPFPPSCFFRSFGCASAIVSRFAGTQEMPTDAKAVSITFTIANPSSRPSRTTPRRQTGASGLRSWQNKDLQCAGNEAPANPSRAARVHAPFRVNVFADPLYSLCTQIPRQQEPTLIHIRARRGRQSRRWVGERMRTARAGSPKHAI